MRPPLPSLLRHPLLHFCALGALLFALEARLGPPAQGHARRIEVSADLIERIAADHLRRNGAPPSPTELDASLRSWIESEVMYREALALGLDRGDVIVRRRLIQKLGLVLDEREAPREPTPADLERWRAEHPDRYRAPILRSVTQVFFSNTRLGTTPKAPLEALDALRSGADPASLGEPFLHGRILRGKSERELAQLLGPQLAEAIDDLPVGQWSGPHSSSFGAHLLRLDEKREATTTADAAALAARARSDWMEAERERRRRAEVERLIARYDVHVDRAKEEPAR